ncbi:MAG: hypothetical protein PVI30_06020 [Myxococcales bacterium]
MGGARFQWIDRPGSPHQGGLAAGSLPWRLAHEPQRRLAGTLAQQLLARRRRPIARRLLSSDPIRWKVVAFASSTQISANAIESLGIPPFDAASVEHLQVAEHSRVVPWLLEACVLLGPVGPGSSVAFAGVAEPCGVSCPCDGNDGSLQTSADGHDDGEPCEDACPDDCPSCGCCPGLAVAVVPVPDTSDAPGCVAAPVPVRLEVLATGACSGVFRPSRSLT